MGNLTIRPARRGDIEAVTGKPYPYTYRAIVAEEDGQVLGIAGVAHAKELQGFSTLNFEPRQNRRFVVQAVKKYRELLAQYDHPIYAKPDDKRPGAEDFLKHVGFQKRDDGLFVWTPSA